MSEKCVVVIDNGGGAVKLGVAGEGTPRMVSPNLSFKAKGETRYTTGDALLTREEILSLTLRRPCDKGYLVNPELQREIWAKLFKSHISVPLSQCGLILTQPLFNFESCHAEMLKLVFEVFGFASVVVKSAAELSFLHALSLHPASLSHQAQTGVVVDAGFSFCHVVPICNGSVVASAVRRIDFGGKSMTNYFKELISFRSLHLMEETCLAESIKDILCFVSQDVTSDLKASQKKRWASPFYKEFILPDGVTNLRGFVRHEAGAEEDEAVDLKSKEQVLAVNSERFMVPEVLFHPTDIGLNQSGLAETIAAAVEAVPSVFHPLLFSNVLLTGGIVNCPGFAARLRQELRPLVNDLCEMSVEEANDPVCFAWKGGSLLGSSPTYSSLQLTKEAYHHHQRSHMK